MKLLGRSQIYVTCGGSSKSPRMNGKRIKAVNWTEDIWSLPDVQVELVDGGRGGQSGCGPWLIRRMKFGVS